MKLLKIVCAVIFIANISCNTKTDTSKLEAINNSIKQEFAPDKRVAIYDIRFKNNTTPLTIEGETNSKDALNKLLKNLTEKEVNFTNKVRVLPDSIVEKKSYAIGKNSVINIRSKPKHSAELGTQGLLGMPLRVYDKNGDFYRVQTPDNYISWVDKGGIELMTKSEYDQWQESKKVIYTKNIGRAYSEKSTTSKAVSDLAFGNLLKFIEEDNQFYKVEYPDGRIGYINKNEAVMYHKWLDNLQQDANSIEIAANTFFGAPYLWGGTSTKGVDCSGFTKIVYLMNGYIIPRDASQQIYAGKVVDENLEFKDLQKGDLLFFGKKATKDKKQRVTHVGIWLGNGKGEFIHSSGNVNLSSINKAHPNYDEFNKNRYLGSRRYLNVKHNQIVNLKELAVKE